MFTLDLDLIELTRRRGYWRIFVNLAKFEEV